VSSNDKYVTVYHSVRSDVLEIGRSAVLLLQPVCASVGLARSTARALGRVGTVVIGDVVVTNITEPG
jgi:hypothetical protein